MSQALHLVFNNVPGYGPTDSGYLCCSCIYGRAVTLSPSSSHGDHRICLQLKITSLKCGSGGMSFVCRAGSSGHRRNPDFSRQRHGSRGRNRQNEDRENFENVDESEMLKNGPLLSLSGSAKFQATTAPGPREKEIVDLFRKVQAKLQERAAAKEDKKTEALQGKGKESETVDSLLKLLRKHSVEQGKRKNNIGSSRGLNLDHLETNGFSTEDESSSFFDSNDRVTTEAEEPYTRSLSRPASNFRQKSPVSKIKYLANYSSEETVSSVTHVNLDRRKNMSLTGSPLAPDQVPELEEEVESVSEADLEPESIIYQDPDVLDELSEDESSDVDEGVGEQQIEHEDLSALKLPELRALAKSRGLKGFSKMKKGDLVLLLTSSSG